MTNPPPTQSPNGLSAERTQIEPQELRERAQGLRKHEFPAAFAVDVMWARQWLEIAADQIEALRAEVRRLQEEHALHYQERFRDLDSARAEVSALKAKLEKAVEGLRLLRLKPADAATRKLANEYLAEVEK